MIDVYNIIKEINNKNEEANMSPSSASHNEIMERIKEQVREDINNLVREKKVLFHKTINGLSFEVVDDEEMEKAKTSI